MAVTGASSQSEDMRGVASGASADPLAGTDPDESVGTDPRESVRTVPGESVGAGAPLTVGGVARLLGVAAATLRTWDRRYQLGPSGRHGGSHRRYQELDVARLALMRQLTLRGVPPGNAARVALDTSAARLAIPHGQGEWLSAPPVDSHPAGFGHSTQPPREHLSGLVGAGRTARALADAVEAMDADLAGDIVIDSLTRQGVVTGWDSVVGPVLTTACPGWRHDSAGVAAEYLFAEVVHGVLAQRIAAMTDNATAASAVLLAGPVLEPHALPLHAVAAAMAERRVPVRLLGTGVPGPALLEAVDRLRPGAVYLWSSTPDTADIDFAALPRGRTGDRPLVLGGPGWGSDVAISGARYAPDLAAAVDLLAVLAG